MRKSPEGTAERCYEKVLLQPSLRDSKSIDHNPGVETPGYYRDVPPGQVFIESRKGITLKWMSSVRPCRFNARSLRARCRMKPPVNPPVFRDTNGCGLRGTPVPIA